MNRLALLLIRVWLLSLVLFSAGAWAVDTDGDGVDDSVDAFPNDVCATTDTDGDGKPNTITCYSFYDNFDDPHDAHIGSAWTTTGTWDVLDAYRYAELDNSYKAGTAKITVTLAQPENLSFWYVDEGAVSRVPPFPLVTAAAILTVDGVPQTLPVGSNSVWLFYTGSLTAGTHIIVWNTPDGWATPLFLRKVAILPILSLVEDDDDDNDDVLDVNDKFPLNAAASVDTDGDGYPDAWNASCDAACQITSGLTLDNCPSISNANQSNTDGDAQGDACDTDIDGDGVDNLSDNCPVTANANQLDTDGNGFGDVCDHATQNGVLVSDNLGAAIAVADMNNDGYADLVIGIPGKDLSFSKKDVGQIKVISGSDGSVLNTFTGTKANQRFGSAIAVIEDQNNDGIPDLIVGSPLYDSSSTKKDTGKVELYSGANGVLLQLIVKGSKAGDQLGASVAVADIDNDGNPNLIVGAPRKDFTGLKDAGQVTVYSGINNTVLYQRNGTQIGEQFGAAIAVDEDLHQLLVGSPLFDVIGGSTISNAGRVSIFDGADGVSAALFTLDGTTAENHFGSSVASFSEDLDDDTFNEWAVGSAFADPSAKLDAGQVEVFSGFNATAIATIEGASAGNNFGAALATGDINNNGENDLAIGSPKFDVPPVDAGRVEVLSGKLF